MDPQISIEMRRRTGLIICQICCRAMLRISMEPVSDTPGHVWDVCRECARWEKQQGAVF